MKDLLKDKIPAKDRDWLESLTPDNGYPNLPPFLQDSARYYLPGNSEVSDAYKALRDMLNMMRQANDLYYRKVFEGSLNAKDTVSYRPMKTFTCKSCGFSNYGNGYIVVDGHDFCGQVCAGVYLRNKGEIK